MLNHASDRATVEAWLRLLRAPRLGASSIRNLLGLHGSAASAIASGPQGWRQAGLNQTQIDALTRPPEAQLEADLAWLQGDSTRVLLTLDDPDYPGLLSEIGSPPPALFVEGDASLLCHPQIAIVGSRHPTHAGREHAYAFAADLARAGLTITSGLAEGVDAQAHRAALDAGGPTIAVMGTGPDRVYPARHRELAAEIAAHGALVTEFPPGTEARREHFPRRNRIVAGLSLATLVIEAAVQSGALISARMAADAGREVLALPGSIHNPLAKGCHALIRQGATLVETVDDILEALRGPVAALGARLQSHLAVPTAPQVSAPGAAAADPEHARVLAALDHDPCPIDRLAERTGLTIPTLSSILLVLELEGRVIAEHGRYLRSGH